MKNGNNKFFIMALLIASLSLQNLNANSQSLACVDSYNRALSYYSRGQFARINNDLKGCIDYFNKNRKYYRGASGQNTVFKVYKLIITSYDRLKSTSLSVRKKNELILFFANTPLTRTVVEARLNSTPLTPIR